MKKNPKTGSACSHLEVTAFGGLFALFTLSFTPFVAFILALLATTVILKW